MAPDLKFMAGHYQDDSSLGGHIHLSVQPEPEIVDAVAIYYHICSKIDKIRTNLKYPFQIFVG